jgi:hypothetical protein
MVIIKWFNVYSQKHRARLSTHIFLRPRSLHVLLVLLRIIDLLVARRDACALQIIRVNATCRSIIVALTVVITIITAAETQFVALNGV